jgi:tetratricopeptide (TPR) repeat protein
MTKDVMMSVDDLLEFASLSIKMERYDTAIVAFYTAFNPDSIFAESLYKSRFADRYFDNYEDAIEHFDRAIELEPDYAESYYNRGCIYKDGDHPQAIRDFTKAIELKPDYAMAYVRRGITYALQDKKSMLAIADIERAVVLGHESANGV